MRNVLCVVLGGGRGTRLFPLTETRAKPAVPLFGKYRLIDIPISNCLNSELNKIYILTQFNSESLNKHIARTYKLDQLSFGFVEIMAAEQSMDNIDWFQGTADAVRRCLKHFNDPAVNLVFVLSGDQLYKMDLREVISFHREKKADITIACNPVAADAVSSYGIMGVDKESRIKMFIEKPIDESPVKNYHVMIGRERHYLGSMGIYLFNKNVLVDVLTRDKRPDFGREIIPAAIESKRVYAYTFYGYWRDIGTIISFYDENLVLTDRVPPIDMLDEKWPIFSRSRFLPPAKIDGARVKCSVISEGTLVESAEVSHSVVGLRSRIGSGTVIEDTIIMGCDYYEKENAVKDGPALGVGRNSVIRRAILDKNVRIGDDVKIVNEKNLADFEGGDYYIKDGIVIIPKNRVIEAGRVI